MDESGVGAGYRQPERQIGLQTSSMSLKTKRSLGIFGWTARIIAIVPKTALAALFTLPASGVTASAEVLVSRYVVSLDGLHVGDATLRTDLDARRYKVGVSADVGLFLVSTQIQGEASGARSDVKLTPEHFQIALSGGDEETIEFDFANSPEAAANGAVRLRGVFDPLSALLAASLKPSSPSNHHLCDAVLPIFTGHDRLDLNLRPKAQGPAQKEPALIRCEATLSQPPAAGPVQHKLDLEIAFMKTATPDFWRVERVTLPTKQGLITIERSDNASSSSSSSSAPSPSSSSSSSSDSSSAP
jgi:hypothetical protein